MNDTFNRIAAGVSNVAQTAVHATGELMEKGRAQVNILALENKLTKVKATLGDEAYHQVKAGAMDATALQGYVEEIDRLETDLAYLQLQRDGVGATGSTTKGKELCPMCGTEVAEGAMFCSGCGHKLA